MFAVDDIDDTLETLRTRGAQLVGEVVRYKDASPELSGYLTALPFEATCSCIRRALAGSTWSR